MTSSHRTGFCGAPWSRTSTPSRFRLLTCLSRRWGTSWWKCYKRSTLSPRTRLSKCPRSFLSEFHRALWRVVLRSWQNSWWKCRRIQCTFLWFSPRRSFEGRACGLLSGQGSTASGSRVVDNPVPRGRGGGGARGGLQGSHARQNSTANLEQIVDIPARRGLPDFLPGQSSTASSSSRLRDDADEPLQGFFALFPVRKKVRSWVRTRGRKCSPSRGHPRSKLMRTGMLRVMWSRLCDHAAAVPAVPQQLGGLYSCMPIWVPHSAHCGGCGDLTCAVSGGFGRARCCATTCALVGVAQCLVRRWTHAMRHSGWLWKNL